MASVRDRPQETGSIVFWWRRVHLRDDTPVRLKLPDGEVNGVLVSFRDGMLVVAVESDLGPKIAFARLLADDSFLIERLKQRLEQVRSGELQCNRAAGERVLGRGALDVGGGSRPCGIHRR